MKRVSILLIVIICVCFLINCTSGTQEDPNVAGTGKTDAGTPEDPNVTGTGKTDAGTPEDPNVAGTGKTDAGPAQEKEKATVNVKDSKDDFLTLRSAPNAKTGKPVAELPDGAEVLLGDCQNEKVTIGGRTGRWCQVTYRKKNGWVFDVWLARGGDTNAGTGDKANCQYDKIEKLAADFAKAFQERKLGRLDTGRPYLKTFEMSMENSLADEGSKEQFLIKQFNSMEELEKWFQSNERKEGDFFFPNRAEGPVKSCEKGVCTFDSMCCLHNTIFLDRLSFGYEKDGCPYIKKVFFIDGN
jgi:hypothetical protein